MAPNKSGITQALIDVYLDVPLLPERRRDYLDCTTFHGSFPNLFAGDSILPISSSPEGEVPSLAETADPPVDKLPHHLFRHVAPGDGKSKGLIVNLPGLTTSMPDCSMRSDYLIGRWTSRQTLLSS
jgi:hypothetical protein